jgi:hypothetical protein
LPVLARNQVMPPSARVFIDKNTAPEPLPNCAVQPEWTSKLGLRVVDAIAEIHRFINAVADRGIAAVVISYAYLPE